jgi:isopenicillin N synthase-like dioxygenase
MTEIPIVDIGPLFSADPAARAMADAAIAEAAFDIGFMVVTGHPPDLRVGPAERAVLLKLFDLPMAVQRSLWKLNFAPENPHIYRGWFPLSSSAARNREGFEIGPDIARDLPADGHDDLLYEPTPLPDPANLPDGWNEMARAYYLGMEDIGHRILASLSRSLCVDEHLFRDAFDDGISTLRLLHYPKRPDDEPAVEDVPEHFAEYDGRRFEQVARAHVDSGLLTVLAQCGVGGLQARDAQGDWIPVPVRDDGFAINFGGLLERWTGGRIKATAHRVLAQGEKRYSVPFFFEPCPSARIAPLSIPGIKPFVPFLYGGHLWATTTKFPENFGLADLRPPRAPYADPMAGLYQV